MEVKDHLATGSFEDADVSNAKVENITGIYLKFGEDVIEWYRKAVERSPEASCREVVINHKGKESVLTFDEFFQRLGLS